MANFQVKDNHIAAEYDVNGNVITQDEVNERVKSDIQWLKENGVSEEVISQKIGEVINSPTSPAASKIELNQVKSQLDETKTKVDTKRDKSTPIKMVDLDTEVKTAMTGGSVAVVGINAVGTENVKPKAISNDKLSFNVLEANRTYNLFDKNSALLGKCVLPTNGAFVDNTSYITTDFISCLGDEMYVMNWNENVCFYTENKEFISSIKSSKFTTPTNCKYFRVNNKLASYENGQIEKGEVLHPFKKYTEIDTTDRRLDGLIRYPITNNFDVSVVNGGVKVDEKTINIPSGQTGLGSLLKFTIKTSLFKDKNIKFIITSRGWDGFIPKGKITAIANDNSNIQDVQLDTETFMIGNDLYKTIIKYNYDNNHKELIVYIQNNASLTYSFPKQISLLDSGFDINEGEFDYTPTVNFILNDRLFFEESIKNTKQVTSIDTDGYIQAIYHKDLITDIVIRSDVFTYNDDEIIEVRTLNGGKTKTFKYNLNTLVTEVI